MDNKVLDELTLTQEVTQKRDSEEMRKLDEKLGLCIEEKKEEKEEVQKEEEKCKPNICNRVTSAICSCTKWIRGLFTKKSPIVPKCESCQETIESCQENPENLDPLRSALFTIFNNRIYDSNIDTHLSNVKNLNSEPDNMYKIYSNAYTIGSVNRRNYGKYKTFDSAYV